WSRKIPRRDLGPLRRHVTLVGSFANTAWWCIPADALSGERMGASESELRPEDDHVLSPANSIRIARKRRALERAVHLDMGVRIPVHSNAERLRFAAGASRGAAVVKSLTIDAKPRVPRQYRNGSPAACFRIEVALRTDDARGRSLTGQQVRSGHFPSMVGDIIIGPA